MQRSWTYDAVDLCGVAALEAPRRFMVTTGLGIIAEIEIVEDGIREISRHCASVAWDNHVIVGRY
ncbi:MAG: hypothetical protein NW216_03760 [Hyphomicrobium sp.]|nr:hypothetical protein [Hyphomicrobium sp.]